MNQLPAATLAQLQMLSAAVNASESGAVAGLVVYPQATIDAEPMLVRLFGDRLCAVESVNPDLLHSAMRDYAAESDWSAFSRADFASAFELL